MSRAAISNALIVLAVLLLCVGVALFVTGHPLSAAADFFSGTACVLWSKRLDRR